MTAGLDFAFVVTARLAGENYAKAEMLNTEYDPAPPYRASAKAGAGKVVSEALTRTYASALEGFSATTAAAVKALR